MELTQEQQTICDHLFTMEGYNEQCIKCGICYQNILPMCEKTGKQCDWRKVQDVNKPKNNDYYCNDCKKYL